MSAREKIHLDAAHPYPGPSSFDEDHAAFFCGREREAEDLFSLVELRPLTVIYGKSGLGKTSVLQAGLFPRMRKAALVPIRIRLLFGVDERGERHPPLVEQVRRRLREAIDRAELDGAPPREGETLWEYFHWTGFWEAAGRPVQAVLVFDQFEEVFTLGHERRRELGALMREISDLVENRIPAALREGAAELPPSYDAVGAKVLIALREEFLAQLDDHRAEMPSLASGRYRLRPLGGADAMRAVFEPGRAVVTEDVAARIVRRLASAPDDAPLADIEEVEPALLALYCHELNALRDKAKLPKIDVALLTGNEKEILDKFYDRCMVGMPKQVHGLVEERLLTPDDRRDTIAFGRAVDLGVDPKHLAALVDRRLLRKVPLLGHEYVQIVHDKLVPTIAKRRDARLRREVDHKARRKLARRAGIGALAFFAIVGTAISAWRWTTGEAALRTEKIEVARQRIERSEARAAEEAKTGWRAAADQRWDDVARALAAAYGALDEAREAHEEFPRELPGASSPAPDLALLAARFEATAGKIEALLGDQRGIERFVLSKEGLRAAALGPDGRSITLIDMASRRTWNADAPGAQGSIDDKDKGPPIEPTAVFSGVVRELLLSGDGSTLFGLGDRGQVAVWRVADGTRVAGFRARLARPSLQVDRSGGRVLVWDRDVDRVLAVTLDTGPSRKLDSVELNTRRLKPKPPGPGRWDHAADWRGFALASDGRRVVGLCEESSRRTDGPRARRIQTEIALWELPAADPIARFTLPGRVESASVSESGDLFATRSDDRELRLFSLADHHIAPKGAPRPLSTDAWFGFHDTSPTLLVVSDKTLALWDVSGEPTQRLDLPLGARARKAALSRDGAEALVWFDDEVRLYDTKLGQPRAAALIPESERRSAAGADVELRIPGAALVVTAKSDAIRVRTLGGASQRGVDRYLWGESSAAKAIFSGAIPRGSVVEDADGDGEQIAVLADGAISLVRSSSADRLEIAPLTARDAAIGKALAASAASQEQSVRALSLRAGHVAAFDAGGSLRFSDARFSTLRRAPSEAGWGGLLAISNDGAWAVTGGRGPTVWVWDADKGALAWAGDVRKQHSKAQPEGDDVAVTAVAITADGPERPRALVGDAKGGVRAVRTGGDEKGVEWTAEIFAPSPHAPSPVRAIEIAADGRIATGADDGTVALWDKDAKPLRSTAVLPPTPVRALRFADEGRLLLGAANDTVRVWKTSDGGQQCALPHADVVRDIAVEPSAAGAPGVRVASVDASGTAIVWTVRWDRSMGLPDGAIAKCGVERVLRGIAYAGFLSAARDRVVTVRRSGRVELWPASDATSDQGRDHPRGASTWGLILRSGALLTGDEENAVFTWKADGSSARAERLTDEIGGVVAVASGGQRAVIATAEGLLRVWSGDASGAPIAGRIPLDRGLALRAAALDDAGERLLTVEDGPDDNPRVRLSAVLASSVAAGNPIALAGGSGCAAWSSSPAGRFFAAGDTHAGPLALVVESSGCVRIWDHDGKLRVEGGGQDTSEGSARTSAAAIDDKGSRVVLGGSDGAVSVWEIEASAAGSIARLRRVAIDRRRHTGRVRAIAFHPRGSYFVTAGDDGQPWLWDASDGHALARLGAHPAPILWAAFRADGSEVVTGGAGGWLRAFATSTDPFDLSAVRHTVEAWLPELAKSKAP